MPWLAPVTIATWSRIGRYRSPQPQGREHRTGNRAVAMHPLAHPEVHERHAYAVLTGLRAVHPTREPRPPTADDIRALDEPFGTLLLELPLREAGYLLPTWDELSATVAAA